MRRTMLCPAAPFTPNAWLVPSNIFLKRPRHNGERRGNAKATTSGGPACHVFLVGFPRSGTTLLEKCLAGHPGIATIEEEESFAAAMKDFFFPPDGLRAWRKW